jgi:hypothetical protein
MDVTMPHKTFELTVNLTEQQEKDLLRFHETTEDGQGYDVPKDRMKSLARVGLIRSLNFSRYEFTDIGISVVERLIAQPLSGTLDERMKAANMLSVAHVLAGGLLDGVRTHAGVHNLDTFRQWLEMRRGEIIRMYAPYDLGEKSMDDDMYEWVLAHSAVFAEVHINFKAAIGMPASVPSPTLN